MGSNSRYTPKQIEKYQRQKYISHLEKIGKNLFRMLRHSETSALDFRKRFKQLIDKLDTLEPIRLDSEYLKRSEEYYRKLFNIVNSDSFNSQSLKEMREIQMSSLNRLQKMKNNNSYKKDKHRNRSKNDGWE